MHLGAVELTAWHPPNGSKPSDYWHCSQALIAIHGVDTQLHSSQTTRPSSLSQGHVPIPPSSSAASSSFQFEIHITGMCNTAADALSHNDTKLFYEILPYGSAPVALRASLQPRAQLDISTLENTIHYRGNCPFHLFDSSAALCHINPLSLTERSLCLPTLQMRAYALSLLHVCSPPSTNLSRATSSTQWPWLQYILKGIDRPGPSRCITSSIPTCMVPVHGQGTI